MFAHPMLRGSPPRISTLIVANLSQKVKLSGLALVFCVSRFAADRTYSSLGCGVGDFWQTSSPLSVDSPGCYHQRATLHLVLIQSRPLMTGCAANRE